MSNLPVATERLELDAPLLRHIVNPWRTAEEDIDYHAKALRAFNKLERLIERAEQVLADCRCGPDRLSHSHRVLRARRELLTAHYLDERDRLRMLLVEDDALVVWSSADQGIECLVSAIGEFLDAPFTVEWTTEELGPWLAPLS